MIETFAFWCLFSDMTHFPSSPFDYCLNLHFCQGLFMVDLVENFLNLLKLFWLWQAISQNRRSANDGKIAEGTEEKINGRSD
jgi:hypothetical protein